jgi:hypothetical protein
MAPRGLRHRGQTAPCLRQGGELSITTTWEFITGNDSPRLSDSILASTPVHVLPLSVASLQVRMFWAIPF